MDYLSIIKSPIKDDLEEFISLFNEALSHNDGMLHDVLDHIRNRAGKRMRPILILLSAKRYGPINDATLRSAVGLELLHTASLVHDDVVDDSSERRGQASVNALFNNKVAILVGDFILSTALLNISYTRNDKIIKFLAELGRVLSSGEILQLSTISNRKISEEVYYEVIRMKTAALFSACAQIGAMSAGATDEEAEEARQFGDKLGIIFQIRDDIFDYYDSKEIGKPTGNDMAEGKLTLPVIHSLLKTNDAEMMKLANKVKNHSVTPAEIAQLVQFTKDNGGIEYAEKRMKDFQIEAEKYVHSCEDPDIRASLQAYLDFVIDRNN
jgi:octaprenyl-diphosphate synthase